MSAPRTRWQVRCERPVAYDIIKAPGLLDSDNDALMAACGRTRGRRFVVVDQNVDRLYGNPLRSWFTQHQIDARIVVFEAGEAHKTLDAYQRLLHALEAFPIHRRDEPIIAIGGGVLTDVAGFVAATYRRGVPHINVPTTLMGYVDAAIGVKTAVNLGTAKNRVGAFAPPAAVLLDPAFLRTLSARQLRNGTCEILKLAIIADATLFQWLEADGGAGVAASYGNPTGAAILDRAVGSMLEALTPNLFETELSRSVDFGHTFSYGLEATHRQHDLLHGEAVLLDVLVSTLVAEQRGLLAPAAATRIFALTHRLGLRCAVDALDAREMWRTLHERIEHRNGRQRVPLPDGIGHCVFRDDLTYRELDRCITLLRIRTETAHDLVPER